LDTQCSEIEAVIAKTMATIEEYKKLKQSIITEAVTKGIRGDRPMKDSGIEWIGDIPADWQVSPLQYYVELNKNTLGEDTPADYEFDYVEIGAVTLENGISEYQRYKFADAPSRARRIVQANDIIISTVRTYMKAIAIVPEKDNVIVSTGFAVLTPKNINIDYLGFALKSEYFVHTVTANSVGISYPAINSSDLIKFKIAIPAEDEQEEIAEYLKKKCAEMDTLIKKKTALLEEMETYKKSVIYEYVTGKKRWLLSLRKQLLLFILIFRLFLPPISLDLHRQY
jgi:type I restriction enzyme S subunit